jgi:predicted transcriptional regulator
MKRTLCEYMMWNGLPVIRKEIAVSMIKNYGLSQKETAEKLGITPAAVCQYISRKRGRFDIGNQLILDEIQTAAKHIIENGNGDVIPETCRICRIIRTSEEFSGFCKTLDEE